MYEPHDNTDKLMSSAKMLAEDSRTLVDDAIGAIVNIALRNSDNKRIPITAILPEDTTHDKTKREYQ